MSRPGGAGPDPDRLIYMKPVPFFANTSDDTHCVQASFKIMLKYFLPERDFTFVELDKMSQKRPGKGTWWPPMLLELKKLGFKVKDIESFDYGAFSRRGETYIKEHFPPEVAQYHLTRTNLMAIRPLMPEFMRKIDIETRPATIKDVRALLNAGWLVGLGVNSRALNNKPGYSGHMVVVFDMDEKSDGFRLHDPGLPAKPNHQTSRLKLEQAWFWAGQDKADLIALKLNEDS
jgi:hypothetical protein